MKLMILQILNKLLMSDVLLKNIAQLIVPRQILDRELIGVASIAYITGSLHSIFIVIVR